MTQAEHIIELHPLRLDTRSGLMWKGDRSIELRPKPWDLMLYMAKKPGELLSKQELLDAVWPNTIVTESSLNQAIKELRKALGDDARSPHFIETVHRRGFRLLSQEDRQATPKPGTATKPIAPIFGRSTELEDLLLAMELADGGQAQVRFVTGEAGIGKTSLMQQFKARQSEAPDLAIGWGQCYDLHGESEAYLPVLESIDRLARGRHGETVQRLLGEFAPSWHSQFPWMISLAQVPDYPLSASSPARMLREFCDFIGALAAQSPVLLWLEDLHWGDTGTVGLLDVIARRQPASRLLLVASYRPVDAAIKDAPVARLKRSLEIQGLARELPLEFLEPTAVSQIAEHRLKSETLPDSLSELLLEQTSGNPLFVSTTLEYLITEGLLAYENGNWTLKAPMEQIRQRCPESLRHIVELQFIATSTAEAAALHAASTAGITFDTQVVAGALECDPLEVETLLDGLAQRSQFLHKAGTANWQDGSTYGRYEFIHDVFRESIHQSLAPGQRQHYHRRIARCMEMGFGDEADKVAAEIGLHAELGGDRQLAVRFLVLAAQRTQLLKAPREALAYFERALVQLAMTTPGTERDREELQILLQLVPALIAVEGYTSDSLSVRIGRARALCDLSSDPTSYLKVLITQAALASLPGDWEKLREIADELNDTCRTIEDPKLLIHSTNTTAYVDFAQGRVFRAREQIEAGIASLRKEDIGGPAQLFGVEPVVSATSYLATIQWMLGRPDQAKQIAQRMRRRAEAVGASQSIATAFHISGTIALYNGEISEARRFQDTLHQCLSRNEMEYCYMRPLATHILLLVSEKQVEQSLKVAHEGIALARKNGATAFSSVALAALAEAQRASGAPQEGLLSIEEAITIADNAGERVWGPELLRIRGELQADTGAVAEAEESFRTSMRNAKSLSLLAFELRTGHSLASFLSQHNCIEEATELLEDILGRHSEGFTTADYRNAQSLLSFCKLPAAR